MLCCVFGVSDRKALASAGKGRRRVGEAPLRGCCIGTATQPHKLRLEATSRLAFMPRSHDAELFHSAAERIGVEVQDLRSAARAVSRLMANLAARTLLAGRPHGSGPRQSLVNRSPTGGRPRSRAATPRRRAQMKRRVRASRFPNAGMQVLNSLERAP